MATWTKGYVTDVPYTYGYYAETNPVRADLALLLAGREGVPPGPCCELGFGQGIGVNVHAAASAARRWWGNDFNAAQVRMAMSLTASAGSSATLSDEGFTEFCAREDLPQFAFVAIHGVWSWISPEDRATIVEFLKRRLMVGGVVYLSYNTAAGWAAMAPVRDLFAVYAQRACSPASGSVQRMREAMDFVNRLLATQPAYLRANPGVRQRIEGLAAQQPEYLPHEYLNAGWTLFDFAEISRMLSEAKLGYVAPALLTDRVDQLHLTRDQATFLAGIDDQVLRETTRDLLTNQQFRRDYWVKGDARMPAHVQQEALQERRLLLTASPGLVPTKFTGLLGESGLEQSVYGPIVEALHDADGPISIAELTRKVSARRVLSRAQYAQAIAMLVGMGVVHPVQDDSHASASREACARLNSRLLEEAASAGRIGVLASPLTGGGISVSHVAQLCMLARREGADTPGQVAALVWDRLKIQGMRLTREGRALETDDENLAELAVQANAYLDRQEPILRRAGIVF